MGSWRDKLRASLLHFLGSVLVIGGIAVVVVQVWYPGPLAEVIDALGLLKIAVAVDVTLGPLLTLVVYRAGKKSLKFDLSVIVLAQLAALAYGVYTMAIVRPVYLVNGFDRLHAVSAFEIDERDLAESPPEHRSHSWTGPRYVALRKPTGNEVVQAFDLALAGRDLFLRPKYYVPYDQSWQVFKTRNCRPVAQGCQVTLDYRGRQFEVILDDAGKLRRLPPRPLV